MDENDVIIVNIGENVPPLKIVKEHPILSEEEMSNFQREFYNNLPKEIQDHNTIEELINNIRPI